MFIQRVSVLEKDVKELKQVDHTLTILESIKSEVPRTLSIDLWIKSRRPLQKDDVSKFIKVKQKRAAQEKMPKYSTTPYDQAAEDEHQQKFILFKMMMASKLAVDPASQRKRRHDDKDQDPHAGSDQGMKKRRTGKDC
ncbi:hypothetical protein Tco_0576962 [Tanacetum coccineum]